MISFFILLYNKYGDTTMERHIKRDISWWAKDPLMKCHVGENAYLFIDTVFKEECVEDFIKLDKYGYSHHKYLNLLNGEFIYVNIDDVEDFESVNNVIVLNKPLKGEDIRDIEMQFADICFYWMQPAEVAVEYINEHFEEEHKPLSSRNDIEIEEEVDDIKQYKLRRSELNARRMG